MPPRTQEYDPRVEEYRSGRPIVLWIVALGVGALVSLPIVLAPVGAHHRVSAVVLVDVLLVVAFAAIARLAIFVVGRMLRRS